MFESKHGHELGKGHFLGKLYVWTPIVQMDR